MTDGRCPLAFLRARLPKYLVAADDRRRPDVEWDVPRVTHAGPESNWRDARQVFLTGATGFLGAHLLRELTSEAPPGVRVPSDPRRVDPTVRPLDP